MFEIGDTLREARMRKGWSLKDAEDATKIRSKYLQALEHDDFAVIPGPTFVKGFLRTYAGFLDLDAALLVDEYRSRYEPEPENLPLLRPSASQMRTSERPRRRQGGTVVAGVLAVVIILVLAWIGWGNHRQEPAEIRSGNVTSSTPKSATTTRTTGKTSAATAKGSGKTNANTSATTTTKAGATATSTGTATTSAAGGAQGVKMTLAAVNDRCFVIVREGSASGRILYQGTMEKGQRISYTVPESAWLTIGNPAAVKLNIDGNPVPVPEPYGTFLIDAHGLQRLP